MRLPGFRSRGANGGGGSPAFRRVRVILTILIVANAILLVLSLRPLGPSLADREAQLQRARAQNQTTLATVRQMRELRTKFQGAIQNDQAFSHDRFIQRESAFSSMLTDLQRLASENQLRTMNIGYQLKEGTKNPGFESVLVNMAVEGQYADLVQFINKVEQSQLFWIVDTINVSVSAGKSLRLNIQLETYAAL